MTKEEIVNLIIEANVKFYAKYEHPEIEPLDDTEEKQLIKIYSNVAKKILNEIRGSK